MTSRKRHSSRKRMESRLRRYHKAGAGFYTQQKIDRRTREVIDEEVKPNRAQRVKWTGERKSAPGRAIRDAVRKGRTAMQAKIRRSLSAMRKTQQAIQRKREKRGWL